VSIVSGSASHQDTMPFAARFAQPLMTQDEFEEMLGGKALKTIMGTVVQTYDVATPPRMNADPHADDD